VTPPRTRQSGGWSRTPTAPLVEALLDQKNLAGIGNLWAVESCFLRGASPWTPVREVDLRATVRLARRMLRHAVDHPGMVTTGDTRRGQTHWVYGRAERPCRRCGTPVDYRDSVPGTAYSRETWWCPRCQPGPFPSLEQRPTRPGLRRGVNEESFGSRARRRGGSPGLTRARPPRRGG
jgi:endonuclease VIII